MSILNSSGVAGWVRGDGGIGVLVVMVGEEVAEADDVAIGTG